MDPIVSFRRLLHQLPQKAKVCHSNTPRSALNTMKRKVTLFLVLLAAVCLPAVAQKIQLDVPFNFIVAGKFLPAGHYVVSPLLARTIPHGTFAAATLVQPCLRTTNNRSKWHITRAWFSCPQAKGMPWSNSGPRNITVGTW